MKDNQTMNSPLSPKGSFQGRMRGRLAAVQALFQIEQSGSSSTTVIFEFINHRFGKEEGRKKTDRTFFAKLTEGAWNIHGHSDEVICGALKKGWSIDRIEPVTRAILRAALYEITETQTPSAVIINEYLNITHCFFDEPEVAFVNGILNTLAKKIRPPSS
ncbi:MAG: transcription antitermination factor NusB [Alphaproteobacteria bacterium]|nr:transcription antitermination factor NusB [Alphaproteobacteria bacterium]